MARLVVKRLHSLAELRGAVRAWDDLWQRSDAVLPTARAETIAQWCESFAADKRFSAVLVEDDDRLVAALPLIHDRWLGLNTAALPGNYWSTAGDLLLDPRADVERALALVLADLRHSSAALLWLAGVPSAERRWQQFIRALAEQKLPLASRSRFAVHRVEIDHDWPAYMASRSKSHRRHLRRCELRAEQEGNVVLRRYDQLSPDAVEPLLRTCFEIEASGWKGREQSAILNNPQACEFFLRQARQLAAWGQLQLMVLEHRGEPIAFEYGWNSKGVYFSPKVGYRENFGEFSPGQLLRYRLLEQLHGQPEMARFDFSGPASEATSKWATGEYPVDRVVVALRGVAGRSVVAAYRHGGPLWRRIRHNDCRTEPATKPSPPEQVPVARDHEQPCEPAVVA